MAEDRGGRILGDMNSYILDWLVAKPGERPRDVDADDEENRINALIAMLSKESVNAGNVVPFKSRKK